MATVAYIDLSEVKSFGNMSAEFFCNTDKKTRDRVAKMTSGEISSELSKVAKSITELYSAFPEIVGEISKSIIGETIRVYTSTS